MIGSTSYIVLEFHALDVAFILKCSLPSVSCKVNRFPQRTVVDTISSHIESQSQTKKQLTF